MSKATKWTPEQSDAIIEKGVNLLVAAAAGSGKTAVLVERIIRRVTDEKAPVDIDRLLVVTFTNAAATEMRERIADALAEEIERRPECAELQRQMLLLSRASITTIHSFCMDVIRNNFHLLDLDPSFRIADQTETVLLKTEALEELFESVYTDESVANEAFSELIESYSSSNQDMEVQNLVLDMHSFVQSSPWPEEWLNTSADSFDIEVGSDFGQTSWGKILMHDSRMKLVESKAILERALNLIEKSEGTQPYAPAIELDLIQINELLERIKSDEVDLWDNISNKLCTFSFERLGRCKKDADKTAQERIKAYRDSVKSNLSEIKENIFSGSSEVLTSELKAIYPRIKCLSQLVIDFDRLYHEKKKEKGLVDFNDLEHMTLNLLVTKTEDGSVRATETAEQYRHKFEEILIDEYQDSNLVQELLLWSISRKDTDNPNVFMVGDVKQSIYRFRQANPRLFLDKYNSYSLNKSDKCRKILLYKNFRSRKEILDAVNYIFRQIMSVDIGELDYTTEESLFLGANYAKLNQNEDFSEVQNDLESQSQSIEDKENHSSGQTRIMNKTFDGASIELHIIETGTEAVDANTEAANDTNGADMSAKGSYTELTLDEENEVNIEDEEDNPDNVQCEARVIASEINRLVNYSGYMVFDKSIKGYRKVQYRDIVILLRAVSGWTETFSQEFEAQSVPVYADAGTGYFDTVEISIMMSLLQIIDNPAQDIPFIAVLRSPIGGFSADELVKIRIINKDISMYEAFCKYCYGEKRASQMDSECMSVGSAQKDEDSAQMQLFEKVNKFLSQLNAWRDKARFTPTDRLIWHLFSETGYFSFVGAMPAGKQKQANLMLLFQRAQQYEKTSYRGLFNFINFIERLKRNNGDMGSAKILGENEDVVRIMSIHKSKGLEFPIVFIAGSAKRFNLRDMSQKVLMHQGLGLGPDYVDLEKRSIYPSAAKQAIRSQMLIESLSEEMRILYVALTRAKEKLYITAAIKDLEKRVLKWMDYLSISEERLPAHIVAKGKSYFEWIGSTLIRHSSCKQLRELAPITPEGTGYISDESNWSVKVWKKSEVISLASDKREAVHDTYNTYDQYTDFNIKHSYYTSEIEKRLKWKHPMHKLSQIPSKITVTELKSKLGRLLEEEDLSQSTTPPQLVERPLFLQEEKQMTAVEKGTLMHRVMQYIDIRKYDGSLNYIADTVEKMCDRQLITSQQKDNVDINRINKFLNLPLGKRMAKASNLNREIPFTIAIPFHIIYGDLAEESEGIGEKIILQGMIDCWFEEENGIVLLDYKTDFVLSGQEEEIAKRYELQMKYYTEALETLTDKRVKERYIVLLAIGKVISV